MVLMLVRSYLATVNDQGYSKDTTEFMLLAPLEQLLE